MTNNLFWDDRIISGGQMGVSAGSSSAPICHVVSPGISYGVVTDSPSFDQRPNPFMHTDSLVLVVSNGIASLTL